MEYSQPVLVQRNPWSLLNLFAAKWISSAQMEERTRQQGQSPKWESWNLKCSQLSSSCTLNPKLLISIQIASLSQNSPRTHVWRLRLLLHTLAFCTQMPCTPNVKLDSHQTHQERLRRPGLLTTFRCDRGQPSIHKGLPVEGWHSHRLVSSDLLKHRLPQVCLQVCPEYKREKRLKTKTS